MAKQPKSIFDIALADARWRQAHLAREGQRMNAAAARSVASNAAVVGSGAIDNAIKAVIPVLAANAQRQGRRR